MANERRRLSAESPFGRAVQDLTTAARGRWARGRAAAEVPSGGSAFDREQRRCLVPGQLGLLLTFSGRAALTAAR